jgi:Flp pilus assembly pilin Flp
VKLLATVFIQKEDGSTATEYALIASIITPALVGIVALLGQRVANMLNAVQAAFP